MRRTRVPLVQMGLAFLLVFVGLSLSGVAGPLSVRPVHAVTTYTVSGTVGSVLCTSNGATWDGGTSTCTIPSTVEWYTTTSTTLTLPSGTTLDNNGAIDNYGTITNNGYIYNYGTITSESTSGIGSYIDNNSGGYIYNYGTITSEAGCWISCTIDNYGYIYNYFLITYDGIITNEASGTIDNYSTIDYGIGGYIYNEASRTIDNYGFIHNEAGSYIDNYGTVCIFKYGIITNKFGGYIYNEASGTITNSGTIESQASTSVFYNYGIITNEAGGYIDNFGTIYNYGTIDNECRGLITGYTGYTQLTCYSVTFEQTGIPTSGVTWGVTVGGTDHTGTGASIVVTGLSGTVSYTFDSPVSGSTGVQYVCLSGCSGSVTEATTVSATYGTQYPSAVPEFPAIGPLLLTVLVFPALLIATRRFRKTSVQRRSCSVF